MVAESGLTKDQIRHRRDKPIYKQYLDAARKKQQPPFSQCCPVSRPPAQRTRDRPSGSDIDATNSSRRCKRR
ncbi:unnamed protein product [Acanthoscelides obtectus]|uniref:Uncharacterized protein n=1 Tax=Acanthoscelides obtectus TaxID=200917 RepID=A0A9P0QHT0_ACAOB|nr:unnamed protein product [Acanthoscelides obtectus]CAK1683701.1 hypothetical protein AOBTE_LOCUS34418 [Acanthoscelides obtectus]